VDEKIRRRMEATLDRYHALGSTPVVEEGATFFVDPARPDIWDANHARHVRAGNADEIDARLARMDDLFAAGSHRRIVVDLDTPDALEARLSLDGWHVDPALQHLLQGPLRDDGPPPQGLDIRLAEDDESWRVMVELTRLDHVEEADKAGRLPWSIELTEQMVTQRREKGPEVRAWIASVAGADVGMFSSMPGVDGVGLVEHLFVRPGARRQGVAVALIAHSVADARARGATDVVIGSDPHDWPKHLYTRLGFEPRYVERAWMRFATAPDRPT
jgi:GNAT superfamily N-acetyltransferase